jgi:hypothetical protein
MGKALPAARMQAWQRGVRDVRSCHAWQRGVRDVRSCRIGRCHGTRGVTERNCPISATMAATPFSPTALFIANATVSILFIDYFGPFGLFWTGRPDEKCRLSARSTRPASAAGLSMSFHSVAVLLALVCRGGSPILRAGRAACSSSDVVEPELAGVGIAISMPASPEGIWSTSRPAGFRPEFAGATTDSDQNAWVVPNPRLDRAPPAYRWRFAVSHAESRSKRWHCGVWANEA